MILGVIFLAALAIIHALVAWPLARRYGLRVLLFSTVAAAALVFGAFLVVTVRGMHSAGMTVQSGMLVDMWPLLIPLLFAFGLSSLSLRKSILVATGPRLPPHAIVRATGAFFGGFAVLLLAALLIARIGTLVS